MSKMSDFVIENGILIKYIGSGGNVIIPDGVIEIGENAFARIITMDNGRERVAPNLTLRSVTLSDSIEHIGAYAFAQCENLNKVKFSSNLKTIGNFAFYRCYKLGKIVLPSTVEMIGQDVFFGHMTTKCLEIYSPKITLPPKKLSIFQNPPNSTTDFILFAPQLPFSILSNHGLARQAVKTFVTRNLEYDIEISKEYINYISSHKNEFLQFVYKNDAVSIIKQLYDIKKITKENFEKDYLIPAKQCGASKCEEFLVKCFGTSEKTEAPQNPLWNGTYFSIDGKQLLKYKEELGCDTYYVPEGTKEICKNAFFMPSLSAVVLPESVTAIQNGAFVAKGGSSLFVKLPNSLKSLPGEAFMGGFYDEDEDLDDYTKYYYVSTPLSKIAEQTCCSSYNKGEQCPVYTGGPLDDLSKKAKQYAVKGFLYAIEHGLESFNNWKESYLNHIKNNEKTYLKLAEKNSFLLYLMIEEHLLSENGVKVLLKSVNLQNDAEIKVALLNYQNKEFPKKNDGEKDLLSDKSLQIKHTSKKQPLQEQPKAQDGIAGIVFVASGELNGFGFINEYTGARDLSDLKEFIESHGGFLRSAVSSKTDYLICNDTSIQTTKVKKAQELGISIISEKEFMKMVQKQ